MRKKHLFVAWLMSFSLVEAGIAQQGVQAEDRLDPNCRSTLVLSEVESAPEKIQTHGMALYVYPGTVPDNFTGCQIVWLENGHKLVTKHYKNGEISWMKGQEPKEVEPFFCLYEGGVLNTGASFNSKGCPNQSREIY